MVFYKTSFFSHSLKMTCEINALAPQPASNAAVEPRQKKFSVLYLLHGLSDDHSAWMRKTNLERYARERDYLIVMPFGGRSFYCDTAYGQKYWSFLAYELPVFIKRYFPASSKRDETFAAGLSMGGFGAFKLALNHPDRFAGAASLSGALDLANPASGARLYEGLPEEFAAIFGGKAQAGSENDLAFKAHAALGLGANAPALYQCCGKNDILLEDNTRLRDALLKMGYEKHICQIDEGGHDWNYWDSHINDIFDWADLTRRLISESADEDF